MKTTNISLAHDSFTQYGGAERVFEAIHELYPEAPIYTLVKDPSMDRFVSGWKIVTSPLQFAYNIVHSFQYLFPEIPVVLKFWKPVKTSLLLSASSSFIKGLRKPKGAVHINYCHTPTRFIWVDPQHAYKEIPSFLHFFAKPYFAWLQKWDLRAANRVDHFIANSKEVQLRIKEFYNRDSEIIYPFVDLNFWKPTQSKQDYFLIAGRLQYAKGLEVVIDVFNKLGLPLHVVGTGRFESQLKATAQKNITFLGRISDEILRDEYSGAKAFIYPQFEDFGMMPLEAAACGTATIGLEKGGSLETIIPGQTGELLNSVNFESLLAAIQNWKAAKYPESNLVSQARKFSKEEFKRKLAEFVERNGAIHGK